MILRLGTRGSKLALAQSIWVKEKLEEAWKGLSVQLVKIKTTGDKILDSPLSRIGGKGVFVKDIEKKLLSGEIDLAVHSMKDVPYELEEGLSIAAIPEREDPRDVFVGRQKISSLEEIPQGARIGTSSLRRSAQLKHIRPDLEIVPIRGNLDTRIRKIQTENLFGIVVAAAGMKRLGMEDLISFYFNQDLLIPAVGQGALAVEIRKDDDTVLRIVEPINHKKSWEMMQEEREFLRVMGGGCQIPMGGICRIDGGKRRFLGFVADTQGKRLIRVEEVGFSGVGRRAGERLLSMGGREIVKELLG